MANGETPTTEDPLGAVDVDISVVVPVLNAAPYIGRQLEALARQDFSGSWEVIVADNGSSDETREIVRRYGETMRNLCLVDASDHLGAAFARNRGASVARGRSLAFCDADDIVAPWWLRHLARKDSGTAIAYGRFIFFRDEAPDPDSYPETPEGETVGLLTHPFGYLPFASSGGMIVDHHIFDLLGGFDESYRIGEDVDFCWRAIYAGYKLGSIPQALTFIRLRSSARAQFRQYFGYGTGEVRLYRGHAQHGMPRSPITRALAVYVWLAAVGLVVLIRRDPFYRLWVNALGRRCGRMAGSWRYRRLYL